MRVAPVPALAPTPLGSPLASSSAGGPISHVVASVLSKLPPLHPSGPIYNATQLVRTVKLSGHYQADVVLPLPSYTRLVLDGTLTATASLNAGEETNIEGYLGTGMVFATGAMIGVEGGVFNCSGWDPSTSLPHNGTTTLAGILFNDVTGGWITGAEVANCGCSSKAGPRGATGYVSGNIWVRQGWGNAIEGVHSHHSCNRGVWAETSKLIVWGGVFSHNSADGLDFDAGTQKSVAYNNVCNNNSRHGVFLEEGASFNTIVSECRRCSLSSIANFSAKPHQDAGCRQHLPVQPRELARTPSRCIPHG